MAEKPKVKPKAKSKPSKSKSTAGKGDNPINLLLAKATILEIVFQMITEIITTA
jgi:hypothetical protein